MRDVLLAGAFIALLVFLDRREDRGGRRATLRKPWAGGRPDDAGASPWRKPWAGRDGETAGERRGDGRDGEPPATGGTR